MSDWLTRFSIKTRLISLLILLAATAAGLTMAGLNGMRSSNADINQMYNNVLLPLDKLGDLTNHMHHARTQLLLALQHQPGSAFEKAHDHPASMHFDAVDRSVGSMRERLADYQRMPMSKEHQRLALNCKTSCLIIWIMVFNRRSMQCAKVTMREGMQSC